MEWVEKEFVGGVVAAHGVHVEESDRQVAARQRYRAMLQDGNQPQEKMDEAYDDMAAAKPLWQRLCGFSPKSELLIEPADRRAGIRRLLRVFERMYRTELKSEDVDSIGGPEKLDEGDVSYAGRSAVWDPMNEICVYLEISKTKLNALSVQRTGLRAGEIGDCIRAEKLRVHLQEKLSPLAWTWFGQLEPEQKLGLSRDLENAAWRLLKWLRGGGRGETRKKLAFELGLTSREKLDRAVMVGEGEALEAVEVSIAVEILRAMLVGEKKEEKWVEEAEFIGEGRAHGAGCDEVGDEGNGPIEGERETA